MKVETFGRAEWHGRETGHSARRPSVALGGVGPDRVYFVEMRLEVIEEKDMVGLAAAQQHHGLTFVLPVTRVFA